MEKINCKHIKYKFIFNNLNNKSSYIYQKVFRSIYGYNQAVYKKKSKQYIYFREGILSSIPYIKSGKNSVIVPIGYEQKLINYFETGINPAHTWREKGDWKVEYEINNIELDIVNISVGVESFIKNYNVLSNNFKDYNLLEFELNKIVNNSEEVTDKYIFYLKKKIEDLFTFDWINKSIEYSDYVKNIYEKYKLIFINYQ